MPICFELKTHFVNLLRAQRAFTMAYAAALKAESLDPKRPWTKWETAREAKQKLVESHIDMISIDNESINFFDRKVVETFLDSIDENSTIELWKLRILYGLSNFKGWYAYPDYAYPDLVEKMRDITKNRDQKTDLVKILNCKSEQISLNKEEALRGNIKYHYGDLRFSDYPAHQDLILPEIINGYLYLFNLKSTQKLILPKVILGELCLGLESAKNLTLSTYVGGQLDLRDLESAENLTLPKYIGMHLWLRNLRSVKGLVFPEDFEIRGEIYFGKTHLPNSELEALKAHYPYLADKIKIG